MRLGYNILLPRGADSWLPSTPPRVCTVSVQSYADVITKFSRTDRLPSKLPGVLLYHGPVVTRAHIGRTTIVFVQYGGTLRCERENFVFCSPNRRWHSWGKTSEEISRRMQLLDVETLGKVLRRSTNREKGSACSKVYSWMNRWIFVKQNYSMANLKTFINNLLFLGSRIIWKSAVN